MKLHIYEYGYMKYNKKSDLTFTYTPLLSTRYTKCILLKYFIVCTPKSNLVFSNIILSMLNKEYKSINSKYSYYMVYHKEIYKLIHNNNI
jgi:hypothetical protein